MSGKTCTRDYLDGPVKKRQRGKRHTVLTLAASGNDYDGSVFKCIIPSRSLRMNHAEKLVRFFWDIFNHHDASVMDIPIRDYFSPSIPFSGLFKYSLQTRRGKFNPLGLYDCIRMNQAADLMELSSILFANCPDVFAVMDSCSFKKRGEMTFLHSNLILKGTLVVTIPIQRSLLPLVDFIDVLHLRRRDLRLLRALVNAASMYESSITSVPSMVIEPNEANCFSQFPGRSMDGLLENADLLCRSNSEDIESEFRGFSEMSLDLSSNQSTDCESLDDSCTSMTASSSPSPSTFVLKDSFDFDENLETLSVSTSSSLSKHWLAKFGIMEDSPLISKSFEAIESRTLQVPFQLRALNTCTLHGEEGHEKITAFNLYYVDDHRRK